MKFRRNEHVETPHGNTSVWRYMAHWKLEKLITNSKLFFPNTTKLTDQYEISIPESTLKSKRKELELKGFSGRDLEEELAVFYWENNPMKNLVLVNCWSINQYESYALWKIYLGNEKNGIAIKSTVSSLRKAVQTGGDTYPEEFFLGKIKYKSYLKPDETERLSVITTKKPYYDFEKELRLFIINYPLSEGGKIPPYDINVGREVKVDLQTMVHDVYISPFADESYAKEVGTLLKSANFRLSKIKQSGIKDQ